MKRIIHKPRIHPAVDIAVELAQHMAEDYVRAQKQMAAHNEAAAGRTEAAAAAARRAEAAGDREWERIVGRHRALLGGSSLELSPEEVAERDDARLDLTDTLTAALDGFVLDDEAQRVVEAVIEPWVEGALQLLPEEAGENMRDTVIVGSIVRLMVLYDRVTRERQAATGSARQ